jgi:hypothetical protein
MCVTGVRLVGTTSGSRWEGEGEDVGLGGLGWIVGEGLEGEDASDLKPRF